MDCLKKRESFTTPAPFIQNTHYQKKLGSSYFGTPQTTILSFRPPFSTYFLKSARPRSLGRQPGAVAHVQVDQRGVAHVRQPRRGERLGQRDQDQVLQGHAPQVDHPRVCDLGAVAQVQVAQRHPDQRLKALVGHLVAAAQVELAQLLPAQVLQRGVADLDAAAHVEPLERHAAEVADADRRHLVAAAHVERLERLVHEKLEPGVGDSVAVFDVEAGELLVVLQVRHPGVSQPHPAREAHVDEVCQLLQRDQGAVKHLLAAVEVQPRQRWHHLVPAAWLQDSGSPACSAGRGPGL